MTEIEIRLDRAYIYLGGPWYAASSFGAITAAQYRTAVQEVVTTLADANVFWVNTLAATTTNNSTDFTDGVHASDVTHQEITNFLTALIP